MARPHRPTRHSKVTPAMRLAVYEAAGWRCVACGVGPGARPEDYDGRSAIVVRKRRRLTGCRQDRRQMTYDLLELDHIISYANGGSHKLANRQALCSLCNLRKGRS